MHKLEIQCNWFCVTAAFCIFTLLSVVDYPILCQKQYSGIIANNEGPMKEACQKQYYGIIANNEGPMKEAALTYFIVLTQLHLWMCGNLVKDFQYIATTHLAT